MSLKSRPNKWKQTMKKGKYKDKLVALLEGLGRCVTVSTFTLYYCCWHGYNVIRLVEENRKYERRRNILLMYISKNDQGKTSRQATVLRITNLRPIHIFQHEKIFSLNILKSSTHNNDIWLSDLENCF